MIALPVALRLCQRTVLCLASALIFLCAGEQLWNWLDPVPREVWSAHPASCRYEARDGSWLFVEPNCNGDYVLPVPLAEVSPHFLQALLAAEDRRFFQHWGVDSWSLLRAAVASVRAGRPVSGASTLTMQLSRVLEPRPRSLWGKLQEVRHARHWERCFDKTEVLERYVNTVPFGGTLRGVEAASRYWFGKAAVHLHLDEAAMLVAMLPAPSRRNPTRYAGLLPLRDGVLLQMHQQGRIDADELRQAIARPLHAVVHPWPRLAREAKRCLGGDGPVVRTSLDGLLQQRLQHLAREDRESVDGVAIVVLERPSGDLLAIIGHRNPVWLPQNAALSRRSAGSTLKPFLYALALERELEGPDGLVEDRPRAMGGFRPANFSGDFVGRLSWAQALAQSRNLPAIRVLQDLGIESWRELLRRAGLPTLGPAWHLDAAMGTLSVSPLELARAYHCLVDKSSQLGLSEASVERVLSALLADFRYTEAQLRSCAVKTGTSSGLRDAWAVSVATRRITVVWRGMGAGTSDPNLIGRRLAVPLLASVDGICATTLDCGETKR